MFIILLVNPLTGAVLLPCGWPTGLLARQLVLLDAPDAALGAIVQAHPFHPPQVSRAAGNGSLAISLHRPVLLPV